MQIDSYITGDLSKERDLHRKAFQNSLDVLNNKKFYDEKHYSKNILEFYRLIKIAVNLDEKLISKINDNKLPGIVSDILAKSNFLPIAKNNIPTTKVTQLSRDEVVHHVLSPEFLADDAEQIKPIARAMANDRFVHNYD